MTIINWKNVTEKSNEFKNQTPFKFGYIKNIFENSFYDRLYDTCPNLDDFGDNSDMSRTQFVMEWGKDKYDKCGKTSRIASPDFRSAESATISICGCNAISRTSSAPV